MLSSPLPLEISPNAKMIARAVAVAGLRWEPKSRRQSPPQANGLEKEQRVLGYCSGGLVCVGVRSRRRTRSRGDVYQSSLEGDIDGRVFRQTAGWRRDLPVVFSYFGGAGAGGVAGASKLGKHDGGSLAPARAIRNMSATLFDLCLTSAPVQTLHSFIHLAGTPSFHSPIVSAVNKSSIKVTLKAVKGRRTLTL